MIARIWHGRVPSEKAEAYYDFLLQSGISDYRATKGNLGILVLRAAEGDVTHYTLITLWTSVAAIKRFAGEDYERAHYYPEDDAFLLEKEPRVVHHEVLSADFTP
jgi:heme-degrading monooxygenase HmoA